MTGTRTVEEASAGEEFGLDTAVAPLALLLRVTTDLGRPKTQPFG
jgi:hypothetical protein